MCKCIYVFKIRRGCEAKGNERQRVGRRGNERGSEGAAWVGIVRRGYARSRWWGWLSKQGLQDATKNVRIYGTISAASNPSAPVPSIVVRRHHRRDATRLSRIALPCPYSSCPLRPPPFPRLFLTPAQIFFSTFPYRRRFAKRTSGRFLLPLLGSSLRASVPSFHPPTSSLSSSPPDRPIPVGRGAPPHGGRAQRGAIAPTAAGTTLMLH